MKETKKKKIILFFKCVCDTRCNNLLAKFGWSKENAASLFGQTHSFDMLVTVRYIRGQNNNRVVLHL